MADIKNWSTTAASNNSAAPNGWPESTMKVNEVNDTGRQMMADIRSWYEDSQWIDFGHTPTRTGATTFTVSGTHTGIYSADRAIRATDASTLYGVVSDSTHSGGTTTVTVSLDAGSLTGSLSAVAVGALTADSATAMPGGATVRARLGAGTLDNVVEDTTPQLGGTLDVNSQSIQFPTTTITDVLDEDTMSSDSATALATQQSIKAYVDANASSGFTAVGTVSVNSGATVAVATGLSGVTRVRIVCNAVSLDGTNDILVQIGDSGGLDTSGYASTGSSITSGGASTTSSTAGFIIDMGGGAADTFTGVVTLDVYDGNTWVATHNGKNSTSRTSQGGGIHTLTGSLDRVSFTTTAGNFDGSGSVNVYWE